MTLEELIDHEEKESKATWNGKPTLCADEHRQLAEWLKDYKRLLEQKPMLDKMRDEFISLYPKNYAGELELGGMSCMFSLNKVLNIIDKYKASPTGAEKE